MLVAGNGVILQGEFVKHYVQCCSDASGSVAVDSDNGSSQQLADVNVMNGEGVAATAVGEGDNAVEVIVCNNGKLRQSLEEKEQQLMSKHLELKDAQMSIQKLEEHIQDLGKSATVGSERSQATLEQKEQLAAALLQIVELEEMLENRVTDDAEHTAAVTALESELDSAKAELEALQQTSQADSTQLAAALLKGRALEKSAEGDNADGAEHTAAVAALESELDSAKAELKVLQQTSEEGSTELAAALMKVSELEKSLKPGHGNGEEQKLRSLSDKVHSLEQDAAAEKLKLEAIIQEQESELDNAVAEREAHFARLLSRIKHDGAAELQELEAAVAGTIHGAALRQFRRILRAMVKGSCGLSLEIWRRNTMLQERQDHTAVVAAAETQVAEQKVELSAAIADREAHYAQLLSRTAEWTELEDSHSDEKARLQTMTTQLKSKLAHGTQLEEKEQQLMSKHLELKDAQMTIQKLEEHTGELGDRATASSEQSQHQLEETEQQLMSKHLELKDAQMTIQKLEEHLASIGSAKHVATAADKVLQQLQDETTPESLGKLNDDDAGAAKQSNHLVSQAQDIFQEAMHSGNGTVSKSDIKKRIQKDRQLRSQLVPGSWAEFFGQVDSDGNTNALMAYLIV